MEKCRISPGIASDSNATMLSVTHHTPWRHIIIDDFIEPSDFIYAQKELFSSELSFSIDSDDKYQVQYSLLRYLPLARLFYSFEFKVLLSRITQTDLSLNESNMVQLRLADNSTPRFPRHIDSSDKGRSLVVIYYMSSNWKTEYGGRLLLHKNKYSLKREAICIEPKKNRLVAFFSDKENWHSIEKVNGWSRYSVMSEWMCE
ncbi:2OG-Fe(II) oxygenase [Photobacterium profundum]|uniref:2OG-Fe(II) oxygenase family protein n=1 Tax=Photobacterium profundum TaxID=74109 RepID=UPI003D0B6FE1